MLYQDYYRQVVSILQKVIDTQSPKIEQAARLVSNSVAKDGMIYIFGCGHSHIVGEDLFYRAGGMAPVCAMLDSSLMLHEGAVKSSLFERLSGMAEPLFNRYHITPKDVLFVISTSGINSVPVEMAQCGRRAGVPVIAIVSQAYAGDASRHASGQKLHDCADIVLDNGACHGDAAVQVGDSGVSVGPISTLSSCLIMQCIMSQAEENLWAQGIKPPVYVSGNLPGGLERNQVLIDRYSPRIKHL